MTFTAVAATPAFYVILASANGTSSYAGDGTSGAFVYGAQVEAGSFATSYIPTTTASATRSADVAQVSTAAFPYSATEGTLVMSASFLAAQDNVSVATLNDGTSSNMITSRRYSDNKMYTYVASGGVGQWDQSLATVVTAGATFKHGLAFATNDGVQSINGGAVSSDTPPLTVPSVNTLAIGTRTIGNGLWNGHIRQITYIPRRLTNAELQTRTA